MEGLEAIADTTFGSALKLIAADSHISCPDRIPFVTQDAGGRCNARPLVRREQMGAPDGFIAQDLVEIRVGGELPRIAVVGMGGKRFPRRLPPGWHEPAVAEHGDPADSDRNRPSEIRRHKVQRLGDGWIKPGSLNKIAGDAFIARISIQRRAEGEHLLPTSLQEERECLVGDRLRLRWRMIIGV